MRSAILTLLLLFSAACFAQQAPAQPPDASTGLPAATQEETDPQFHRRRNDETLDKMEKDQQKQLNLDRQKQLQKDTERLLTLATELKQYVDRTNENILSLEVMKKAEEIEKLAHQVRDKMKAH